ncbi:hypothetical protein HDU96_002540 [Phlyctochytrium bullatum]|nr:hypothetical protein HDU96_002540 [Phlyctochytrium bullatum]
MKHGVKVFQKKLNRSPAHRRALLRNLATSLILHGRIETTVPKAKFLRHMADKLVEWAKRGDYKLVHKFTFDQGQVIPRMKLLAARFEKRHGGYTRIIHNGVSSRGDKAPMAIIEYIDGKNDTIRLLAERHLGKVQKDLEQVRSERYNVSKVSFVHPVTKEPVELTRMRSRPDLSANQTKALARREHFLLKLNTRLVKSQRTGPLAQAREKAALNWLKERKAKRDDAQLAKLQKSIDALPEGRRKGLVRHLATRTFSATPLMSRRVARMSGRTKTIYMDPDTGRLKWVSTRRIGSLEMARFRAKFASVEASKPVEGKDAGTGGSGLFTNILGKIGGKSK